MSALRAYNSLPFCLLTCVRTEQPFVPFLFDLLVGSTQATPC